MGKSLTASDANVSECHRVPEADLSREEIFEVLSNHRRRCTLRYLKQIKNDTAELREIVDFVTAAETGKPIEKVGSNTRKCVYTALRQSHLPKLDEVGIIEYDSSRGTVTLTDGIKEVHMYMEYVPGNDIPWAEYYLGLTAVLAALGTVVWTGIYPFDGISFGFLSLLIIVLFGVSSVVHTYHTHKSKLGSSEFPNYDPTEVTDE